MFPETNTAYEHIISEECNQTEAIKHWLPKKQVYRSLPSPDYDAHAMERFREVLIQATRCYLKAGLKKLPKQLQPIEP